MIRNFPITGLLICLTLTVTVDIAVRLGWALSIRFDGGIDAWLFRMKRTLLL